MPSCRTPEPKVQPKHLLLELLLASGDRPLPVSHAVAACAVFGLSENHVRVTLARLAAQDMVLTTERGAYRLGPAARSLARDVAEHGATPNSACAPGTGNTWPCTAAHWHAAMQRHPTAASAPCTCWVCRAAARPLLAP